MKLLAKNSADGLRIAIERAAAKVTRVNRQRGLGDTGYDETDTFRAIDNPGQLQLDSSGVPAADPYANPIAFNLYPFATNSASGNAGSVQLLSLNQRRQLLLIQNLSTGSDLYVNFGTDAGLLAGVLLTSGVGVLFDEVCPNNAVYVFFNSAANQPGVIIEGTPQG